MGVGVGGPAMNGRESCPGLSPALDPELLGEALATHDPEVE